MSLLLSLACVLFFFSPLLASLSTPTPSSSHDDHKSAYVTIHDNEIRVLNHFKVSFTHRVHGQLSMSVSDVTTSSILVKWHLSNRTFNDSTIESMVICETFSGLIVSKKVVSSTGSHRVEGLQSDSGYFVCVYMLEKPPQSNVTVFHCNCHNATTIPVLRSDSIIGVILTLGYIFLMAAIGYFVWRKRAREISEDKVRITVDEDDDDEDDDDVLERGHFNAVTAAHASRPAAAGTKHVTIASKNSSNERRNLGVGADNSPVERSTVRVDNDERGDTNGCLDFRRSRDSSAPMLCSAAHTEMDDRKQTSSSRSNESSPIKVTEITF